MINIIRADYFASFHSHGSFVKICYRFLFDPGFQAVSIYRIYSSLYRRGSFLGALSKIVWRINVILNSCYIMPNAVIGKGFCLPHPVGVIIGEGVNIGEGVTIYQGVTLGVSKRGRKDYPTVGNGVTIYAAAIVYGDVHLKDNITISCNSVVSN
jgi:serine O-acetyltransferase